MIESNLRKSAHDIHSFSRPESVRVSHLRLNLKVRFDRRTIEGTAVLTIEQAAEAGDLLLLDSRDLRITGVECSPDGDAWRTARFDIGPSDPILGAPLKIEIAADTRFVRMRYATDPGATALQWLAPEQTAGGMHPFLYTQSQAIHARSWIPLQDSPGVRITWEARVELPPGLKGIMSGIECSPDNDCHFAMNHPVPPYLIALAVGDLAFEATGPRTGVWAEPTVLPRAATEFSDMENMLEAAERLYGPYRWGRYDVLVLPPSFPFGGMENPCLTFATPTIIAGDKSLVSLVAHELAHSWSGNLVTNATWSDFWLNEGFTVYIERRIIEQLYGVRRADREAALGYQELRDELNTHSAADQILHINLEGRDPDDGATQIPYEKGVLFLRQIERAVGRERFDAWLKTYFDHFAFQSITTEQSLAYLREHLFLDTIPLDEWIYAPGVPSSAVIPVSEAFHAVDVAIARWMRGEEIPTADWSTQEWLRFLHGLPLQPGTGGMERLDSSFPLTSTSNNEILAQWLLMAVRNHYRALLPKLEEFLTSVGRRKYIRPLYETMSLKRARAIYERARPLYHPITQATIDGVLKKREEAEREQ